MMSKIPERKDVSIQDTWDLTGLYSDISEWETDLARLESVIPKTSQFKGTLGDSVERFAEAMEFINREVGLLSERLGHYISLRQSENIADGTIQGLYNRYVNVFTKLEASTSWMNPEILSLDDETIQGFLEHESLKDFRIPLTKLLRKKPHTLSEKEENLLAKQIESTQIASETFSALTNVDMDFGKINTDTGEVPLSQSTFALLMQNENRQIREQGYKQFFSVFDAHKNTLANLYSGSVLRDKYLAEVRGYPSALAKALFPDNVPEIVYENLISSVRTHLPALHDYYKLRAKCLEINNDLRPWDVYVPLVKGMEVKHTWEQAVDVVIESLSVLGDEYINTLRKGLLSNRWADRYENKGKRSGAFSSGSYSAEPYILMNYKEEVLRDVFTMTHEGGHSMHSWYSMNNNPFPYYDYTIFEAEVASTFNEQLLAHSLIQKTQDKKLQAYLLGKQIDDTIATIFRQTMFAEFERDTHAMAERGEPLTLNTLRSKYRSLLEIYFGSSMHFEDFSDLEGLRIPHFYRAFYVYKYATGLSAAVTLSQKVLNGGIKERNSYLDFLKSGGSLFPLDSLKIAGVDMSDPSIVDTALHHFGALMKRYRALLHQCD